LGDYGTDLPVPRAATCGSKSGAARSGSGDLKLRIAVHDFGGYPFAIQLSRELARRGHHVLHLYSAGYFGGKGRLGWSPDDPAHLEIESVKITGTFSKYSMWRRPLQDLQYGARLRRRVRSWDADILLTANTPLIAHAGYLARRGKTTSLVYWHQDLLGPAMKVILRKRIPIFGRLLGRALERLEIYLLNRSDQVITISHEFEGALRHGGVATALQTIPNWAPLDELPVMDKNNSWSRQFGLSESFVFLYAGTLGLKHDPTILLRIAASQPKATVVVVSGGPIFEWLKSEAKRISVTNIEFVPFQAFERLPEVHGAADVLVVLLESTSMPYAVPSKVLTYFCAARPILGVMPQSNPASSLIRSTDAGEVVTPGEDEDVAVAVRRMASMTAADRAAMGTRARRYAELHFEIESIATQFEEILRSTRSERPA
jgi:colanic acid biosynthesis glycosyl transferase WcaI